MNDFLNYDSMIKGKIWKWFSFKDMLIIDDDIFVRDNEVGDKECFVGQLKNNLPDGKGKLEVYEPIKGLRLKVLKKIDPNWLILKCVWMYLNRSTTIGNDLSNLFNTLKCLYVHLSIRHRALRDGVSGG